MLKIILTKLLNRPLQTIYRQKVLLWIQPEFNESKAPRKMKICIGAITIEKYNMIIIDAAGQR